MDNDGAIASSFLALLINCLLYTCKYKVCKITSLRWALISKLLVSHGAYEGLS